LNSSWDQAKRPARFAQRGSLRIIGGQWRSRRIEVAGIPGLRPTPDRVRQTLFDWLQHLWAGQGRDLRGMRVLDAFAGSGALGLEAGSRGASHVCFLEKHPVALRVLARNISGFRATSLRLLAADALQAIPKLGREGQRFDLIILDPPFASEIGLQAARLAIPLLSDVGLLYVESDRNWDDALLQAKEPLGTDLAKAFELLRQARAGAVHYHLLKRQHDDKAPSPQVSNLLRP